MYLKYGSYTFPTGEVAFTITKAARHSPRGVRDGVTETWNITGTIHGSSQAEITTKIDALQNALSLENQELIFYQDDGTISSHALLHSQATGGIRVKNFSFPRFQRSEYATGRSYSIVIEGEFPDNANQILSYSETVQLMGGGGPRYAYLETFNGAPQRQQVSSQTLFRAIQTGTAISKGGYPVIPAPLFPSYEDTSERMRSFSSPQNIGGVFTNYGVQWGYSFTSDVPLFAYPGAL